MPQKTVQSPSFMPAIAAPYILWGWVAIALVIFTGALMRVSLPLLAATVVALGVAAIMYKRIHVLLAAIPVLLVTGWQVSIPLSTSWYYEVTFGEIVLAVALLALGVRLAMEHIAVARAFDRVAVALAIFLALAVISGWYVTDGRLYLAALKVPVAAFVSYVVARFALRGKVALEWWLLGLAAAVIAMAVQMGLLFADMGFSSRFFFDRSFIRIPVGAIAYASSIIVLSVPLLTAAATVVSAPWKRYVLWSAAMLGFGAVALSLGKGALLSLAIGWVIVYAFVPATRHVLFSLVTAMVVGALVFVAPFVEGLLARIGATFIDENTQFRLREFSVASRAIRDNWLGGLGVGQQLAYYGRYLFPNYNQLANNVIIQVLLDLGIVGLAVAGAIAAAVYRTIRTVFARVSPAGKAMAVGAVGSIAAGLVNGMVEVTFFGLAYAIIWWQLVGAAAMMHTYENEHYTH